MASSRESSRQSTATGNWEFPALQLAAKGKNEAADRENSPLEGRHASRPEKPTKEPTPAHWRPVTNFPFRLSIPCPWAKLRGKRFSQSAPLLQLDQVGCRFLSNTTACAAMDNELGRICHRENHCTGKSRFRRVPPPDHMEQKQLPPRMAAITCGTI